MAVIYTEPHFVGKGPGGHGWEHYVRQVYCACGKQIGTQTKYDGHNDFYFDDREKADYKFCPYCGKELK